MLNKKINMTLKMALGISAVVAVALFGFFFIYESPGDKLEKYARDFRSGKANAEVDVISFYAESLHCERFAFEPLELPAYGAVSEDKISHLDLLDGGLAGVNVVLANRHLDSLMGFASYQAMVQAGADCIAKIELKRAKENSPLAGPLEAFIILEPFMAAQKLAVLSNDEIAYRRNAANAMAILTRTIMVENPVAAREHEFESLVVGAVDWSGHACKPIIMGVNVHDVGRVVSRLTTVGLECSKMI